MSGDVLTFDPDDERTYVWLLVLLGVDPEIAKVCGECGHVWPDGCHLTEALAHLDVDCSARDDASSSSKRSVRTAATTSSPRDSGTASTVSKPGVPTTSERW